ncbi:hypothetical protein D3C71_1253620 [compost metagenome]
MIYPRLRFRREIRLARRLVRDLRRVFLRQRNVQRLDRRGVRNLLASGRKDGAAHRGKRHLFGVPARLHLSQRRPLYELQHSQTDNDDAENDKGAEEEHVNPQGQCIFAAALL